MERAEAEGGGAYSTGSAPEGASLNARTPGPEAMHREDRSRLYRGCRWMRLHEDRSRLYRGCRWMRLHDARLHDCVIEEDTPSR